MLYALRTPRVLFLAFLGTAGLLTSGCRQATPSAATKPVDVEFKIPTTDKVTDYQDFTGRLEAVKMVDVRARVTGYVTEVPFKEGDLVKEDDMLFQIDARTYQADYNQALANYNLATADLELQEKNAVRVRKLLPTGAIAQEDFDQVIGALEKSRASVGSALAARDHAKLYLDFTRVTSPVSGRISRRFVDPGNLVMADNTILTSVVTEDPMWAYFDVDERTYLDLVEKSGTAIAPEGAAKAKTSYPVFMEMANETTFTHAGTINFVDNRLNANTGTIRLRGAFENPKRNLKAGMFVRIRLPIGTAYSAYLIPDEAILSDQNQKYVYIVNGEDKMEYRKVIPGQAIGKLRVIKDGLAANDHVIVTGMQRVKAGTKVQAKEQPPAKPPGGQTTEVTDQKSEVKEKKSEKSE